MKRKVKNWEEYPLEDVPAVVCSWVKTNIITKIRYYNKYPWMIKMNLKHFIAEKGYYLACYIDPAPPSIPNESGDEYFDRIDPKYGLRFYKAMAALNMNLDFKTGTAHIDKIYKNEERRKLEKQQLIKYIAQGQENIEKIKKYQLRQQLFNNHS